MAEPQPTPSTLTPVKPKKKRFGWKLILIVLIILAAGGGGAAFWMWKAGGDADAAANAAAEKAAEEPTGLVAFEPFLVNLADGGGQSYLRVTLKLLVSTEDQAKELDENPVAKSRVRSAILETLATQSAGRLVTPEGKAELKGSITKQISALKHPIDVRDVLFADFVVQY